jgi:putative lipoic acid-binding regulatory protein
MSTPERPSLIEYPSEFPIKVMGMNVPDFAQVVADLVRAHDPQFDAARIEMRPSSSNTYMGLTLFINATSREQLDAIYLALTGHPLVKVVI